LKYTEDEGFFKESVNKLPLNVVSFQETVMIICNNTPLEPGILYSWSSLDN
jgi:hypothetical protein